MKTIRNQPDLADAHMNNWAKFLKKKTAEIEGIIINSEGEVNVIAIKLWDALAQQVRKI